MRLFVAIDLGDDVKEAVGGIQRKMRSGGYDLKMVEAGNLHMTLKFLGEVDAGQKGRIEGIISDAVKGFHPFTLSFHGVGYFGSASFMKVIWAGVKEGSQDFVSLAESLDKGLSFIRKDEHGPSPHLTIARVRQGTSTQKLAHDILSLKDVNLGEACVKEIKLKESVLTPQGPIYSDLRAFPLKG